MASIAPNIGTRATIFQAMLACQMCTVAVPSRGAPTSAAPIANGPTAALRLPQLPDQSMTGASTQSNEMKLIQGN